MISFQTFTLDNGLRVIVHENHQINKVAVDIIYRVGSRDEDENMTGLAHLFEHLMFGGSANIPEYDTPLQLVGGQNNAFTTSDITNYYLVLPANQIETAFWLESDRMLSLAFTQKSLDVQKSVVCEEFKQRYLNQPYGDAYLKIRPVHFTTHPYKWATIGKELSHIEKVTLEDIKEFFYSYYAPNNATLVVAGNTSFEQVKKLAQKWFGPIPYRELKKTSLPHEPIQKEERKITAHGKVPAQAVYKCYHVPERTHEHHAACDIITDILANGKNSRLHKHMIKQTKVASSINAFHWGAYDPGMLSIEGKVSQGRTIEEFKNELDTVLQELYQTISAEELERMNNKIESMSLFYHTSVMNIATSLAIYDSLGNPDYINTWQEDYLKLKPQDIRNAMDLYLRKDNCTTLYYLPN